VAAAVVAAAATMTATGRGAPPSGHSTGAGAAHLGHVVGQTLQLPPALCRPCRQARQHHMHGILHQRLVPPADACPLAWLARLLCVQR
jgi:hypothetical protein